MSSAYRKLSVVVFLPGEFPARTMKMADQKKTKTEKAGLGK